MAVSPRHDIGGPELHPPEAAPVSRADRERTNRAAPAWDLDGAHRDPFTRRLWPWTSHLLLAIGALFFWIYFFLLSRTTVSGRRGLRIGPGTLLVSNHQSSVDSVLIWLAATFPGCLFRPGHMPWSLAAREHFFHAPVPAWFSDQIRCIPVRPGGHDLFAARRLEQALATGPAILFPEGRRSRDGVIGAAFPGAGLIVLEAQPRIIPVAIEGLNRAVRHDRFGLRCFHRLRVSFGEPIDFSAYGNARVDRATAAEITGIIMERIRAGHRPLARPEGRNTSCSRSSC